LTDRRTFIALLGSAAIAQLAEAQQTKISTKVYYVDNAGDDSDTGLIGHPWQTCSRVNSTTLNPGDVVIFTAGQTFAGPLNISNSGTVGQYIRIGTGRNASASVPNFANGDSWSTQSDPATITVRDAWPGGINLTDAEYIWVDNLIAQGSASTLPTTRP